MVYAYIISCARKAPLVRTAVLHVLYFQHTYVHYERQSVSAYWTLLILIVKHAGRTSGQVEASVVREEWVTTLDPTPRWAGP